MKRFIFRISVLIWMAGLPNAALATRLRIDPKVLPSQATPLLENPWDLIAVSARSEMLSLLNFIVDTSPNSIEGVDFQKYNRRAQFGTWINSNADDNCYNTRAEILIRYSLAPVTFSERNPCTVKTGKWHDPYTGLDFKEAGEIQIDHLVPLKNAYLSGAWQWDNGRRCHFANFLDSSSHLLAVNGRENMRKGDRSPAEYMPPDPIEACPYLQDWLSVKAVWNLTLDENEARAIQNLMRSNHCEVKFQVVDRTTFLAQKNQASHPVSACQ